MLPHSDRRTVLKATGGLLAGTMAFTGTGTAQEEGLQLTVQQATIKVEKDGTIPVRVTFPDETFFPDETLFPDETFLGVESAFETELTGEGEILYIKDEGNVANPVRVMDFSNPHENGKLMKFFPDEIFFPEETFGEGEATMVLGVFPGGQGEAPGDYWDTDTVRIINGIY